MTGTAGTVYRTRGAIHDAVPEEGIEIPADAASAIGIVADNIDSVVLVADNIGPGLDTIPDAVAAANASATAAAGSAANAASAAASAIGTDSIAQGHAQAAAASAAEAATAAASASTLSQGMGDTAEQAAEASFEAEASAALARRWANELPSVEVEPGGYSGRHFANATEILFASAPNLQGRTFGPHAGEAGTDAATQTFNNAALDFGRAIVVQRLANRPTKLKLVPGLFTGPPRPDADLALAPILLINQSGTGSYVEIEGPDAGGGGILEPSVIASASDTLQDTTGGPAATTRTITLDIPAGSNRRVWVLAGTIFHSSVTTPVHVFHSPNAAITAITQRGTAGTGNQAGSAPILTTQFEAVVAGSAAVPACQFQLDIQAVWSSFFWIVKVIQNVSGTEDHACTARAGAVTTETVAFSPSQPKSMVIAWVVQQGANANPIALTPNDSIQQSKTPGTRSSKDFAYAVAVDSDRPASSQTYSGSSATASPAVIGGMVLLPVTTAGGSGALIWKGTAPPRVQPGDQASIWAGSDGSTYYLSYLPAP